MNDRYVKCRKQRKLSLTIMQNGGNVRTGAFCRNTDADLKTHTPSRREQACPLFGTTKTLI